MIDDNPKSTASIAGHPLHPMLIPFPVAFLVTAFVTDLAFWWTGNATWATVSMWLLGAGIIMALVAALFGFTDFLGDRRIREYHGRLAAYGWKSHRRRPGAHQLVHSVPVRRCSGRIPVGHLAVARHRAPAALQRLEGMGARLPPPRWRFGHSRSVTAQRSDTLIASTDPPPYSSPFQGEERASG
jgi:hypothetical protein